MDSEHPEKIEIDRQYEAGKVTINSLNLSYRRWFSQAGKAENPPFLLIHGLASGLRIWDFVAPELARLTNSEVVALDQRGHGLSDKPDSGYDNAQIVSDDFGLATQLNLHKPIVVGHSWGGSIALAYATMHSQEVSGAVLVDGGMSSMNDRPDMTWEKAEKDLAPPDFAGTPASKFLDFYRHGPQGRYFEPVWSKEFEDAVLNIVELRLDGTVGPRLSRANHLQILKALYFTDANAYAANVTCPILMISAEPTSEGNEARTSEWSKAKRDGTAQLKTKLVHSPKVEFVAMPDTVHDIPLQRPAQLAQLIVNFGREAGILTK